MLYVVAGIFFGRIADRWNRRNLLVIVLTFWSSMMLLFGFAKNFAHLFLARVGIGAGTGGTNPTAISMASDIFPASSRGLAMGIYQVGGVVGFSAGICIGGAITQQYGWRPTMISFGLFGLVVAILILALIDEPVRRLRKSESATSESSPPLRSVFGFMWSQKSLVHFAMGSGLLLFTENVGNVWTITYFIRSFDMELTRASSIISVIWLIAGLIGALIGGVLMDRLFRGRRASVTNFLIAIALTKSHYVMQCSPARCSCFGQLPIFAGHRELSKRTTSARTVFDPVVTGDPSARPQLSTDCGNRVLLFLPCA